MVDDDAIINCCIAYYDRAARSPDCQQPGGRPLADIAAAVEIESGGHKDGPSYPGGAFCEPSLPRVYDPTGTTHAEISYEPISLTQTC